MSRGQMKQLAALAGVDGAVFYSLLTKIWQSVAGIVTLLLIARVFSPREQGVYYTYNSVLALQIFFELGFSFILMQFASHERALTQWTTDRRLIGDPVATGRVSSLVRLAAKWYSVAAGALIVLIIPLGIAFFRAKHSELSGVNWIGAWILLAALSAGSLLTTPFFAILEGLGLVRQVAAFRTLQEVVCGILLWAALYFGMGLYSACVYQGARFLCGLAWLATYYRPFFYEALRSNTDAAFSWFSEIWPLQWKISLSWVSGYLANQLFVPIAFALESPLAAGQLGMSLSLVSGLSSATLAWMTTKAPRFGLLVAQKSYAELDAIFYHTLKRCVWLGLIGSIIIFTATITLRVSGSPLANRILAPTDMFLLLVAVVSNIIISAEAVYLRSHKQEPYLTLSVVNGIVSSLAAFAFGHYWGVRGMLSAYCLIMLIGVLWGTIIFRSKRRLWHISALK